MAAKANQQHRWTEKRMITQHGYVKIRVGPSHPLADSNGYAYEHLVVWCSAGRPRPDRDHLIHHINEVKTDNRIENLGLKLRVTHSVEHNLQSLSDDKVRKLRQDFSDGDHTGILANRYKIPIQRAWKIVRGKTRVSAGGPIYFGSLREKKAGRTLDGRTWDEMPEVSR